MTECPCECESVIDPRCETQGMCGRERGSDWNYPVWHRDNWRIFVNPGWPYGQFTYAYCHEDYDGAEDANDHRHGYAATIEACKAEIDEQWPPCVPCKGTGGIDTPFSDSDPVCHACDGTGNEAEAAP